MKKSFLLLLLLPFLMIGCGTPVSKKVSLEKPAIEANKTANAEKKQIVASFYPLAFMTEEIVGDKAEVTDLAGNQEVHDFIPGPQDMVKLNKANLVIIQGIELEPWAEDMIPQLQQKNIPVLKVSEGLALHKMEEGYGDPEEHHGEFDPHTWLDPVLAQAMVQNITQKIIEIDPENADFYKDNSEKLAKKLQEFDKKFKNLSCQNKKAIVSHDAFDYVSRRYGFSFPPIAGLSTNDEPSAKILAELKKQIKADGITTILTEENTVKRFAETLARETGLKILPIYTLEKDATPFFSGYAKNFESVKKAFSCQ